jgi:hypothetical protein
MAFIGRSHPLLRWLIFGRFCGLQAPLRDYSKAAEGRTHSKTLRAREGNRTSR